MKCCICGKEELGPELKGHVCDSCMNQEKQKNLEEDELND